MAPSTQPASRDSPSQSTDTTIANVGSGLTLNHLPNEVLVIIFGKYDLHPYNYYKSSAPQAPRGWHIERFYTRNDPLDRDDLLSLCLTSKRFRYLAQPIIYQQLPVGLGNHDHWKLHHRGRRLALFLRTLVERRDLAALVSDISLHLSVGIFVDSYETLARAVMDQTARALGIQLSAFLAEFPELQELRPNPLVLASALASMLVAILPNLDTYNFEYDEFLAVRIRPQAVKALGITLSQPSYIDVELPFFCLRFSPFMNNRVRR